MKTIEISIIIPALNEEKNIETTLNSILSNKNIANSEIIVVDNGSSDKTTEISKKLANKTIVDPKASIAKLRNIGAQNSTNEIIAFIDADITLDKHWFIEIKRQIVNLKKNPLTITGHRYFAPSDRFLSKYWFSRLQKNDTTPNYINSGNLITTKEMFCLADGFTETLKTAEDYDFCQKAKKLGGKIVPNPNFIAWHRGYPETFFQFIKRESWHGSQDAVTLSSILASKTALMAASNLIILAISITVSITNKNFTPLIFYFAFITAASVALAINKTGRKPMSYLPASSLIALAYLSGRTISFIKSLGRH